eukprot:7059641-Prorocentrum_lima.AAC.1
MVRPEHETLAGRVEVLGGVPNASATYGLRHMPFPRDELPARTPMTRALELLGSGGITFRWPVNG